jgi:hypothetical protein
MSISYTQYDFVVYSNPSMWPQLSSPLEHFFLSLSLLVHIGPGHVQTGSVCA